MTIEELNQYDALNESSKKLYKDIMTNHPGWNHKQIMAYISVYDTTSDLSSDELINEILTTSTPGYIDARELISEKIKDMFK